MEQGAGSGCIGRITGVNKAEKRGKTVIFEKIVHKGGFFGFKKAGFKKPGFFLDISKKGVFLPYKPKNKQMKAILTLGENFGTIDGKVAENKVIRQLINEHLKLGTAKLLVDTETVLMYQLGE